MSKHFDEFDLDIQKIVAVGPGGTSNIDGISIPIIGSCDLICIITLLTNLSCSQCDCSVGCAPTATCNCTEGWGCQPQSREVNCPK
jgi:hypothetical protein